MSVQIVDPKTLKALNKHVVTQKPFVIKNLKTTPQGQPLHVIATDYKGLKAHPSDLIGKAGIELLDLLDRVWLDKKEVAEGILADLVTGCTADPKRNMSTAEARERIMDLKNTGYIDFSDGNGNLGEQAWTNLPITEIWFRLTDKFVKLLVATPI